MMNANEMRMTAEKVVAERALTEREKVLKVIENKIIPAIKTASANGEFSTVCRIDNDINISKVSAELNKFGYKVYRNIRNLRIKW